MSPPDPWYLINEHGDYAWCRFAGDEDNDFGRYFVTLERQQYDTWKLEYQHSGVGEDIEIGEYPSLRTAYAAAEAFILGMSEAVKLCAALFRTSEGERPGQSGPLPLAVIEPTITSHGQQPNLTAPSDGKRTPKAVPGIRCDNRRHHQRLPPPLRR